MLRARWLGRVPYGEADRLQRALHERASDDYLLLLEHPHVYTLGTTADPAHVLVPPASVGAELVHVDRGGDVTYHGPGQLVGYPIVTLPEWRDGLRDVVAYVRLLEDVLIGALAGFGIEAHREPRYTGVWVGDEKIAAIGVKVARGRTRHGFALNVDPDLAMFDHIVPCGIREPRRHVDGRGARRGAGAAHGRRRGRRAVLGSLRCVDAVERQDVVWREHPDDLSAFTRAAMGSDDVATSGNASANARSRSAAPVRLLGRLAEAGRAGVGRRPRYPSSRVDAGEGRPRRQLP